MTKNHPWSFIVAGLVLIHLALGGCVSSAPSRYYTLNPVRPSGLNGAVQGAPEIKPSVSVGVMPVEIPDYLDRPEIVTRDRANALQLAELDRWGGELRSDVTRVLAETLSAQFHDKNIAVLTGRRAISADYRVAVNVIRLDPLAGENVWLRANWSIAGNDGRVLVRRDSNITEPIRGRDYQSTVTAMSNAVDRLGDEIAEALKPVLANAGKEKTASDFQVR